MGYHAETAIEFYSQEIKNWKTLCEQLPEKLIRLHYCFDKSKGDVPLIDLGKFDTFERTFSTAVENKIPFKKDFICVIRYVKLCEIRDTMFSKLKAFEDNEQYECLEDDFFAVQKMIDLVEKW